MNINKLNPYALRLHAGRGPGGAGAYGAGAGTGSGGGAAGAPAGTFLLDTFSSSSAQDLDGRTGEIGAEWSYNDDTAAFTVEDGLLGITPDVGAYRIVTIPGSETTVAPFFLAGTNNLFTVDTSFLFLTDDAGVVEQTELTGSVYFEALSGAVSGSGLVLLGYDEVDEPDTILECGLLVTLDAALEVTSTRRFKAFAGNEEGPGAQNLDVDDVAVAPSAVITLFDYDFFIAEAQERVCYVVTSTTGTTMNWRKRIISDGEFTALRFGRVFFDPSDGVFFAASVEDGTETRVKVAKINASTGALTDSLEVVTDLVNARATFSHDGAGAVYAVLEDTASVVIVKVNTSAVNVVWAYNVGLIGAAPSTSTRGGVGANASVVVIPMAVDATPDGIGLLAINASTGGVAWQVVITANDPNITLSASNVRCDATNVFVGGASYDNVTDEANSFTAVLPIDGSTGTYGGAFTVSAMSVMTGASVQAYTTDTLSNTYENDDIISVETATSGVSVIAETATIYAQD